MNLSNNDTSKNLEAAFGGESMANRKYLFFADVTKKLGMKELSQLFKETANQETEHAFAHFRLIHPELAIEDISSLTTAQKKAIAARCLELAIAGESYEYTIMYPEFTKAAQQDRDSEAVAEFEAQTLESQQHAQIFRKAAHNFGLLTSIEQHHARQYTDALSTLDGKTIVKKAPSDDLDIQKWHCRQCSMIYNPVLGDPDSGIAPGTSFMDIPDDWYCPICGATKKSFVLYAEPAAAA